MGKERWVKGKAGTETLQVWWYGAAGHDMLRVRLVQGKDWEWSADFGIGQLPFQSATVRGFNSPQDALGGLWDLADNAGEPEDVEMISRAVKLWGVR